MLKRDNQRYYYETLSGKFLGSKAREKLVLGEIEQIKPSQSFLEVGCAQGHYLKKALDRTGNVAGFDISKEFIKQANDSEAACAVASAEKIPYKSNCFDLVLCTEVLEHVHDWKEAVREIKRVTKAGGRMVVTIPLEKAFFWSLISALFPPEKSRGHLHMLSSQDIIGAFKPMKLCRKEYIQLMSQTLNKVLPQLEAISMYGFFVFEKQP